MNVRDSQWLTQALIAAGHKAAELHEAEIVFINTCSVRAKPERKVKSVIARAVRACPNLKIIGILGCVAQQLGENLFEEAPQLTLVAGGANMAKVPDALANLLEHGGRICLRGFDEGYIERPAYAGAMPSGSAFVNIMQGCDNFCSYCIVPFTRGRQKSRSLDAVVSECGEWLAKGAAEITLLGQNVNAWGQDMNHRDGRFSDLLREVSALPGLRRLRFTSPHPKDFKADSVACFADLPNLCPRLHLPLQAGSDAVLKAMRRGYDRDYFLTLIHELRQARPDIALSTDLIAGFPGENEEDFEQTLDMMEKCGFMASYTFCYSDRPGTRAESRTDKIPDEIKIRRLARLQSLQDKLGAAWLQARVGGKCELLIDGPSAKRGSNTWAGKDIYGTSVNVELPAGQDHCGRLVQVLITEAKKHSLVGVSVS